ncbi:MAG: thioredoxin domain-containing protein [Hahellaceae bacterium]|nr:thioredoxin domain-containing protein [Hahellaceae bacterium]MCP5210756.1 thioredoxin domain-containing protein [Hahellaceae bacterium]
MTQASSDSLRSKIIFAFFAFALGMAIATLIAKKTAEPVVQTNPLFEYKGKEVTFADLDPMIALPLYDEMSQSYEKQMQLLKGAALQLHIKREAQAKNIDEDSLSETLFTLSPPTDDEVNNFWKANLERIQRPFNEVEDDIKNYLYQQKINAQQDKIISDLKKSGDLAFTMELPDFPKINVDTDGYPYKGNTDAPVHIVEFADYQCPHCKEAHAVVKGLLESWTGQIKVTYMDFPINRSGISRTVAEGAVCADEQGKFWEYHDEAFADQSTLDKEWPSKTASKLALDMEKFSSCLTAQTTKDKVTKSEQAAIAAGARGTPTFFVNGLKVSSHDIKGALDTAINAALNSRG